MNETPSPPSPPETPATPPASRRRGAGVYYGPAPQYGGGAPGYPAVPAYYGGGGAPPYGGPAPYYGGGSYYGPYYGQGSSGGSDENDSLIGAVTIGRMIRVCTQRWMTIAVVAVLGAVGAFAIYRTLPSIYQGSSIFEMSIRRPRIMETKTAVIEDTQLASGTTEETFNTRLAKLRSWDVVQEVIHRFRADNPSSTVTDDELLQTLVSHTELALQRRTRLVRVNVRSVSADLAAALANAYALTIDSYTQEENRQQAETAVAWLKTTVEAQRRALQRTEQVILDFRVANQIDAMESDRKATEAAQQTLNAETVMGESQLSRAQDLVKALEVLQNDPEKFGSLPESAPRSAELLSSYQRLELALTERNVLLTRFTATHPDVIAKEKEIELLRQQFADVVTRTRETAKANLDLLTRQVENVTKRREEMDKKTSDLELKIVSAKMKLESLIREREVADLNFRAILNREQEARLATDENTATIKIIEKALPPKKPVSPDPFVVLPSGPIIGILLGILFVMLLDHLEDKITGIPDIEQRIRLKVLAVLPHIRRARREQVALLSVEDRFSHFAEAFAGLRNLLDSPRYSATSKVILIVSTQPGEGKTITASNFALSCALSGQRTLLVDCDLRRPRVARVYSKGRKDFESLSHALASKGSVPFERLPIASGYPNLDLVCSRSSSELSPSNLLGSDAVSQFIDWTRQNYDRVIIDSPPFGLVSDAVVLGTLADGLIVMCCPDRTRFRPLKHAVRHLSEAGGHILGVLVNDVDFGRSGMFSRYDYHYHYSYRYKYGYKYGYGSKTTPGTPTPEESADADASGETGTTPAPTDGARKTASPAATLDEDDE